jgi:formylglycine-generating enzyme required for sulfatase activity
MARIEKTVFISYRRTDVYTALAVYENLKNQGYDVFFDYTSISSGDFEQIITSNIRARAHFLLILTPTALDRCNEPGDWLRREIEIAIDEKRNIIPLFFKGFRFGAPSVSEKLTDKLKYLSRYNGLNVHEDYFQEAMQRVCTQFLNIPLDTVLHPVSTEVQKMVKEEQIAADKALEQIEDVEELVGQAEAKLKRPGAEPAPSLVDSVPSPKKTKQEKSELEKEFQSKSIASAAQTAGRPVARRAPMKAFPFGLAAGLSGALLFIMLCIWGGASIWNNLLNSTPESTRTSQPTFTQTLQLTQELTSLPTRIILPTLTFTPLPNQTPAPPTPAPGIGSTMTGKDNMTLLYVPAGEFIMGSDDGEDNEKPVHTVYLNAYWIDQTEVTNKMYSLCVDAGACEGPTSTSSYTHSSYYGNARFGNYPVIYVDWNMAKTYCEWADRRLPTEAEWEKAARGPDANIYPWGNKSPDANLLNYNGNIGDTTEVGAYPDGKSMYGAMDMAGNVWEWVNDWYSATYYSSSLPSNPLGPESGQYRVLRGSSWYRFVDVFHSSYRLRNAPDVTYYYVGGFRCALGATP